MKKTGTIKLKDIKKYLELSGEISDIEHEIESFEDQNSQEYFIKATTMTTSLFRERVYKGSSHPTIHHLVFAKLIPQIIAELKTCRETLVSERAALVETD